MSATDWRAGFYAAVADWVRAHNPGLDIASVIEVSESIDLTPGYSVANDEIEVTLNVRYLDSRGIAHWHWQGGGLGSVIKAITAAGPS